MSLLLELALFIQERLDDIARVYSTLTNLTSSNSILNIVILNTLYIKIPDLL